ncbi:MAG: hypothetical protein GY910_26915, partial [bacterium]|nr:hypothetical protein [bacterium]
MPTIARALVSILVSINLAACAASSTADESATKENTPISDIIAPIPIAKSFLEGKGLVEDDPTDYDTEGAEGDAVSRSSSHLFHHDKI